MTKGVLKNDWIFSQSGGRTERVFATAHKWAGWFDIFLDIFGTNDVAIRDPVINRCRKDSLLHLCRQKQA